MTNKIDPDFIIHAGEWATMWGFEPKNDLAKEFLLGLGAEDWQFMGSTLYADHRPARDLARLMVHEGYTVMHPKYGYFQA